MTTADDFFVSVYAPDLSYPLGEYGRCSRDVSGVVRSRRGGGRFRRQVIIGGDFNLELTPNVPDFTGLGASGTWQRRRPARSRFRESQKLGMLIQ